MKLKFLETLSEQILVLDGAMGTMIQNLNLSDMAFGGTEFKMLSDLLTFSRPKDLKQIHLAYLEAGANIIETNTFGASPLRLQEYDFTRLNLSDFPTVPYNLDLRKLSYSEMSYYLAKVATEIAQDAIQTYSQNNKNSRPLFVAASIGPSNWVLSSTSANLKKGTFSQIMDNFYHQVLGHIDGGADILLFETQQDALELKAGLFGAHKALKERNCKLPIMAQVTVDQFSKMQIFNTDIHSALVTVAGLGVDVFGINCSIGPDLMYPTVKKLSKYSPIPISVIPNAGLPVSEDGETVFKLTPQDFVQHITPFIEEFHINITGGCCGTTPEHISAIVEKFHGKKPTQRETSKNLYISGPQNAIKLDSSENLIMIGERLNVRGSAKVKKAVENEEHIDQEALEEVVHEQIVDLGLTTIDVCMDSNIVNTEQVLPEVIQAMTNDFSGAMCIDSFSVEALEKAVEVYNGRPIINSISLEEYAPGVDKIDAVLSFAEPHNPIYIALVTDIKGPALTAQDKFNLAKRIVDKTSEKYGVHPGRLFIDVNAFPIGSESIEGMNFSLESIQSIPLIKKIHPEIKTTIGIGNLTNGLAKKPYMRKVLTSIFLDEARKVGLDAAIINPNHYVPVSSLDSHDYQLGLKVILERDMDAFAELEEIAIRKKGQKVEKRTNYDDLSLEDSICKKIIDGFKERSKGSIEVEGHHFEYIDKIVLQVAKIIEKHEPLVFINDYLMKAMKELGDGFGNGDVSLPHLLKSADVMKQAMGFLEAYMKTKAGVDIHSQISYKGIVVLGTVYQDVHSIGKDLTKTLLENYGYRVIDLGVQVPLQKFIDTAKEHKADAIGMSALLVQTSNHMITVSKMLLEQNLPGIDILIGGAPVNSRHAGYVAMAGQEDLSKIRNNVFYCTSGMDGVNIMNKIVSDEHEELLEKNKKNLLIHYKRAKKMIDEKEELLQTLPRRNISFEDYQLKKPNYFSQKTIKISLSDFKDYLDRKTLYSLNWKFGGKNSWEKKGVSWEILDQKLEEWIQRSEKENWLLPQGVIGIYPCQSEGDELIVYNPENLKEELERFDFDAVVGRNKKDIFSAAQYYYPTSSGKYDAIGLQISTAGNHIQTVLEQFKKEEDLESCLYLQGLSDRIAEDMADYLHNSLRKLMEFVSEKSGTRYSPGYPALTNLENNLKIFRQLNAESEIGVTLTGSWEFSPTGSTAAVVCFHPEASYS